MFGLSISGPARHVSEPVRVTPLGADDDNAEPSSLHAKTDRELSGKYHAKSYPADPASVRLRLTIEESIASDRLSSSHVVIEDDQAADAFDHVLVRDPVDVVRPKLDLVRDLSERF